MPDPSHDPAHDPSVVTPALPTPRTPGTADTQPSGEPTALPRSPGTRCTGEIARGGMGVVYAARDLALDREVAIKVLLPGSPDGRPPPVRRASRRSPARLPHPGIPPVHELGALADGRPFLAMKLVRGRTLAELLKARAGPAHDLPRFVQVFEQVCQAVGFAHARGVDPPRPEAGERDGRRVRRGPGHGLGTRPVRGQGSGDRSQGRGGG